MPAGMGCGDSREGVHHGGHGGLIPGAHVVKVQHALHGPRLHAPHDGLGVAAEQGGALPWWAETQRVHLGPHWGWGGGQRPRGWGAQILPGPASGMAALQDGKGR